MMKEEGDHGLTTISVRDDMMDDVEILSEPHVPRHELCGPRRRLIALGIGVVVIIIIVIISVAASDNKNEAPASPNEAVAQEDQALFDEVKLALDKLEVPTEDMLLKDSYQHKAFTWLTHEDNSGYNRTQLLQRYALAALHYSTNHVAHEKNKNPRPWNDTKMNETNYWLTAASECSWYGIQCDSNGKVNDIVLEDLNLSGRIPPDIALMADPLRKLDFSANEILMEESDFPLFTKIHRLTSLHLDDNYIVTTNGLPTELMALTNLVEFVASWTEMSGELENGVLPALTKLTYLDLESNFFTGAPHFLGDMSSLEKVYLGDNQLYGHLNFLKSGKLTKLSEIWLDHNTIGQSIPTEISLLKSLVSFSCSNTTLTGKIPSELGSLPNLKKLWLFSNKLTGSVPTELGKLSKLEVLDISDNEIDGTIPTGVCKAFNASTYEEKKVVVDCEEVKCACCQDCNETRDRV